MKIFIGLIKKLDFKSIAAGLLCLFLISVALVFVFSFVLNYYLCDYGLSADDLGEEEFGRLLEEYRYHRWFMVIHALDALSMVVSSFVAGKYSKQAPMANGLMIGVIRVIFIVVFGGGLTILGLRYFLFPWWEGRHLLEHI